MAGAFGGGVSFKGRGLDFDMEPLIGGEPRKVGSEGVILGIAVRVFDVSEGGGVDAGDGCDVLWRDFADEDEAKKVIEAGLNAAAGIEAEG